MGVLWQNINIFRHFASQNWGSNDKGGINIHPLYFNSISYDRHGILNSISHQNQPAIA